MEAVSKVSGRMAPLDRADVDTDQIIPKQFLKRIERTGYGPFLFFDWRAGGDFVLDKPEHAGASVLVTGANFGCGSSREHAPWGLQDYGFQAIVAPSFADIFYSNCTKIGLLPVVLGAEDCHSLARAGEGEIDLDAQEVRFAGEQVAFAIDHEIRHRLLGGLDDIALTLQQDEAIAGYEDNRERTGPVTTAL
jgi:3-isopropylmalate/(R)-2-methylmalate dehydratase small subunit